MNHTPGPWKIVDGLTIAGDFTYFGSGLKIAAITNHNNGAGDQKETMGNAHLIAAAPEMLDALKKVVEFWDSITMEGCVNEIHVAARAAIAKAEGRS